MPARVKVKRRGSIVKVLRDAKRKLPGAVNKLLKSEAKAAWLAIKNRTPRSKVAFPGDRRASAPHTADLWLLPRRTMAGLNIKYLIDHPFNRSGEDHKGNIVNDGAQWNLLASLEYGGLGYYLIMPRKQAGYLKFFSAKTNSWVTTAMVVHPPMFYLSAPAAMIRKTKEEFRPRVENQLKLLVRKLLGIR